jgi:hypothetical protein
MDFDALLYRTLDDGKEFNELIPEPNNTSENTGNGDTGFSISEMKEMVSLYNWQMQEVAKVLQSSSLEDTVLNVKDWVCYHFQYKADGTLQLLRSPSRAWQDRQDGIDCKSYSIIASSLLLQLGIIHYIRKIKQPGYEPTEFTHVYVVVPVDQQTGNLDKGYYTVDGTLETDAEPEFVEAKDLFMNELPHARLNAPAPLNGGISIGAIKSLFNLKNLTSIKNLLSQIGCLGGSAYDANMSNAHIAAVETYFNNLITKINASLVSNDKVTFAKTVAEFFGMSKVLVRANEIRRTNHSWNACTTARIDLSLKIFKFYRDVVGLALDAWLTDNFIEDTHDSGLLQFTNFELEGPKYGFQFIHVNDNIVEQVQLFYYTPKPKKIPNFEITTKVSDLVNSSPSSFNAIQFLQSLYNTAVDLTPAPTNNPPISNNGTGYNDDGSSIVDTTTKQAGFGVAGWLVLAGGAALVFSQMKDKPATNTVAKKTITKSKK